MFVIETDVAPRSTLQLSGAGHTLDDQSDRSDLPASRYTRMNLTSSSVPEELRRAFVAVLRAAANRSQTMTRTKVVKLLYLCDLRAVERGMAPFSGARWVWHHYGPYDTQLRVVEDHLVNSGLVDRTVTANLYGSTEYRLAVETGHSVDLDPRFWEVVDAVVGELGHSSPSSLKDLTYQTAPMQTAQARGDRGVQLDLSEVRPVPDLSSTLRRLQRVRDGLAPQETDEAVFDDMRQELNELAPARREATTRILGED